MEDSKRGSALPAVGRRWTIRARRVMVTWAMTKEQPSTEKIGEAGGIAAGHGKTVSGLEGRSGKKRVLWLHTQPEHYHMCMMDDLARGTGYRVAGMAEERSEEFEYIAAFSYA